MMSRRYGRQHWFACEAVGSRLVPSLRALGGLSRTIARSFAALVLAAVGMQALADDAFPLRDRYEALDVRVIDLDELAERLTAVVPVDVRSPFDHDILRIDGAVLLPINAPDFDTRLRELAASTDKLLVFYCFGRACEFSYEAALRADRLGIDDVRVFDAGIADWAREQPAQTLLFGERLESRDQLISPEAFRARLLSPEAFVARVERQPDAMVLDIRPAHMRDGVSLFHHRERHVPLEAEELTDIIEQARVRQVPLLVFDETGQRVRWLQYFLERQGLRDYAFMEGGARAYYDQMVNRDFRL